MSPLGFEPRRLADSFSVSPPPGHKPPVEGLPVDGPSATEQYLPGLVSGMGNVVIGLKGPLAPPPLREITRTGPNRSGPIAWSLPAGSACSPGRSCYPRGPDTRSRPACGWHAKSSADLPLAETGGEGHLDRVVEAGDLRQFAQLVGLDRGPGAAVTAGNGPYEPEEGWMWAGYLGPRCQPDTGRTAKSANCRRYPCIRSARCR